MEKSDSEVNKDNKNNIVLGITLDHEDGVYRAQRWLKGTVVCSVLCDNTSVGKGTLRLTFVGKESAWSGSNVKEKTVFEDERVLQEFEKGAILQKGLTSHPFSIFLPRTIAPSMQYEDESPRGGGCALKYKLCATLGSEDVSIEREVKIVGATISEKAYPYWLAPTCISPRSHGPAPESCLVVCVQVDNTHVGKGQKLAFSVSCRNFSKLDLQRVDVRLVEEIHWTPPFSLGGFSQHEHKHCHTLGVLRDVSVPSIIKTQDDKHAGICKENSHTVVSSSLRAEMTDEVHAKRNQLEVLIPERARDSYEGRDGGKLIKVDHFLNIVMVIRDKATDPQVSLPIKIMDPPIATHHRANSTKNAIAFWPKDPLPLHSSDHDLTAAVSTGLL